VVITKYIDMSEKTYDSVPVLEISRNKISRFSKNIFNWTLGVEDGCGVGDL
jgi:hypothetical protein